MEHGAGVEQELKIPVADLEAVRRALSEVGAELLHPASREVNLLFDAEDGRIAAAGRVLRVRRYDRGWLVTLKGPAAFTGGLKTREELETEVHDGEVLTAILERLGYRARMRYEKDRELWGIEDFEVALDRTPLGSFVEIEGPGNGADAMARRLGLDPEAAVRGSYVSLWRDHRARHPELDLPTDMVFPE